MEDLFRAGFTREDVLGALRVLPFVRMLRVPMRLHEAESNDSIRQ
jgi:hypothetical protein